MSGRATGTNLKCSTSLGLLKRIQNRRHWPPNRRRRARRASPDTRPVPSRTAQRAGPTTSRATRSTVNVAARGMLGKPSPPRSLRGHPLLPDLQTNRETSRRGNLSTGADNASFRTRCKASTTSGTRSLPIQHAPSATVLTHSYRTDGNASLSRTPRAPSVRASTTSMSGSAPARTTVGTPVSLSCRSASRPPTRGMAKGTRSFRREIEAVPGWPSRVANGDIRPRDPRNSWARRSRI
jgi:hypothetical protein